MNIGVAFVLIFWLIAPILYCKRACQFSVYFYWPNNAVTNIWNSAYFPFSGHFTYDNTGSPYIVQNIITKGVFDPVKYAAYSPVFMPITIALTTGTAFATFPALLTHTLCGFLFWALSILPGIYHKF